MSVPTNSVRFGINLVEFYRDEPVPCGASRAWGRAAGDRVWLERQAEDAGIKEMFPMLASLPPSPSLRELYRDRMRAHAERGRTFDALGEVVCP